MMIIDYFVCKNQDLQDYGGFSGLGRCRASFCGLRIKSAMTACLPLCHSRVGGNPQGRVRGRLRHTGFKAVSTGRGTVICISIVTSLRT